MQKIFYTIIFISFIIQLSAQNNLPLGQWKSHLPYHRGLSVSQSENKIYYSTAFSIFTIDKEDNSVSFISKEDGLAEVGISFIKFNSTQNVLFIVYENSNIDLLKTDGTTNISDIKDSPANLIDRTIYDVYFEGEAAYLATGFGVSKLNLSREEFEYTTFTGTAVKGITIHNNMIHAATDEGIYVAENNENSLLADFNNWRLLDVQDGFPPVYKAEQLLTHKNNLYAVLNDSILYQIDNNELTIVHQEGRAPFNFLTGEGEHLIMGFNSKTIFRAPDGNIINAGSQCVNVPHYAIEDETGTIWYADAWRDIRQSAAPESGCTQFKYNSPITHNVNQILVDQNNVYVATGGFSSNLGIRGRQDGFFTYIDGTWTSYFPPQVPALRDNSFTQDFHSLAIDPNTGNLWIGTLKSGIAVLDADNNFTFYNTENSSLEKNALLNDEVISISDMAFDDAGNLWAANFRANNPFSVRKIDGSWKSFNVPYKAIVQLAIDHNGYKWFAIDATGVLVYDDNGTIDDTSDDRSHLFNSNNSELINNAVRTVEVDLEGSIWVGTSEGVVVFECGTNVFDNCSGVRPFVEVDGFGAHLLSTENVTTIAIDGANRKWFGTTNGVFVQSPDGKTQVDFFNANNSPLLDNSIIDIAINQENGEVFMGTGKGIISYQGEAIEGGVINSNNTLVYPNPVRPEYEGPIAIKGLATDADVKITDASGQLVFETSSLGGQAVWDGRDYTGRKVNSGVYLVFSTATSSLNSPDAVVAKILLMH